MVTKEQWESGCEVWVVWMGEANARITRSVYSTTDRQMRMPSSMVIDDTYFPSYEEAKLRVLEDKIANIEAKRD